MNYNHFTINYIKAIKKNLKISLNSKNEPIFFPDKIKAKNIESLKNDLNNLWLSSESALSIVKAKHDSTIQSCLFGLVNNLDTALKIGFLISDRVVLIDYIFERLLKRSPEQINLSHLGAVACSLASALPLAENGRIVMIPNPFSWNEESKIIIEEVSQKTLLTVDLISLLNTLSITRICNVHPYTIADSDDTFNDIINNQIDHVDSIGRDGAEYAYKGILGGLLSEKLLKETELKGLLNIPLSKYSEVISSNSDFYNEYLTSITFGGSLNSQVNIDRIRREILSSIERRNQRMKKKSIKALTISGGVSGAAIGVIGAASVVAAPILIIGAALTLSSTLTSIINTKDKGETTVLSVFNRLNEI